MLFLIANGTSIKQPMNVLGHNLFGEKKERLKEIEKGNTFYRNYKTMKCFPKGREGGIEELIACIRLLMFDLIYSLWLQL